MEACQETGFRLILKCTTRLKKDRDVVLEEKYLDLSCAEAADELENISNGEKAPFRSGPASVFVFALVSGVIGYLTYSFLKKRQDDILNEVYSKLTIVKNNHN